MHRGNDIDCILSIVDRDCMHCVQLRDESCCRVTGISVQTVVPRPSIEFLSVFFFSMQQRRAEIYFSIFVQWKNNR